MKKTDTFFIGLMLFSMYFGAGNLMFPPFLGDQSGTSYWLAITGFIATGVGLPVVVLVAVALTTGGAQAIGNRVNPIFSKIFMVIIYLCIGPFLAIPRNATVAYEMGVKPFLGESVGTSPILLAVFIGVFFLITCLVSLNPSKMSEFMGRLITPTLLVAILILCVAGFIYLDSPVQAPTEAYQSGSFFKGFIEGYATLDALGSLAYGIVIMTAIHQKGVQDRGQLTKNTIKAGFIAGLILALVYISLGIIGTKMSVGTYENGVEILVVSSSYLFGSGGTVLLGLIFTLACFTTVVGLTTACGQYFSKLMPKLSYHMVVILISLVGFTVSNLGLNQILTISAPFLVTAYPITIVLITLVFFDKYLKGSKKVYGSAVLFTGIVAIFDGVKAFGFHLGPIQPFIDSLPLASSGLGWVIPAIVGTIIGLVVEKVSDNKSKKQGKAQIV
ncbi:branched-chain amino acid transport system II carrier protein [Risungbinella massiliensis]|uniref:branched-chain amino acid transport system II carrier protein n=1 Tax=Risungbinella massiliensis TaxID=1329796 RepID=UPI0005CC632B|nr:branched-chain amino acid transport system II carrier protein [Risungbinella massiliensis]